MKNQAKEIQLKKDILVKIIQAFFSDNFSENIGRIPYIMRPKGSDSFYRCCIYKERSIIKDRVIAGLGFSIEEDDETILLSEYARLALARTTKDKKFLTVLDTACKMCEPSKIYVTDLCQGCVARSCQAVCRFGAISIRNGRAVIDQTRCKNCKLCLGACSYSAILQTSVPCEKACPVAAIAKNKNGITKIDFDRCIYCGQCVTKCPFGAVHEKSQLVDIMKIMGDNNKVIALIAPSVVGQFSGSIYQLKSALIKLGFYGVYEVAEGADMTIKHEAHEFEEKMRDNLPFMTTSCCASYNQLVEKWIPEIKPFVSSTQTPLRYSAKLAKEKVPDGINVFISPCVAKRIEGFQDNNVDYVIGIEELEAILIVKQIVVADQEESFFTNESSKQGRNFCISGGVANAVTSLVKNKVKIHLINGLNQSTIEELIKYAHEKQCPHNLIEVMGCEGGCIGGNATIINSLKIVSKAINEWASCGKDIQELDEKQS